MTASELMERLNAVISEHGDMAVVHGGGELLSEPRLHLDAGALGNTTLVITGSLQRYEDED